MVKKCRTGAIGMCCALVGFILVILFLQASYTEGFSSYGSDIHNTAGSAWVNDAKAYNNSMGSSKRSNYKGTPVPLNGEEMFFFKDNQFKPECCPATYSNSTGCACTSDDQKNYLNERGGNRTVSTNY